MPLFPFSAANASALLTLAQARRHWGHRSDLSKTTDQALLKAWDRQAWCLEIWDAFLSRPRLGGLCFVDPLDESASLSTWSRHIHVSDEQGGREEALTASLRRLAWHSPGFAAEVVLHPPVQRDEVEGALGAWAGAAWVGLCRAHRLDCELPSPAMERAVNRL